jgi:hypothetical protein
MMLHRPATKTDFDLIIWALFLAILVYGIIV